jgi:urease accessory protein
MPNTPTSRHAQLVIWHLTDSALPTGSFAHSAGLETYIQANQVHDAASFSSWLHGYLRQASFNDALAVKFAVELVGASKSDDEKLDLLAQLDALLHAAQTPKQVRVSMNSMGKRMSRVASIVAPDGFLVQEYARAISARTMHGNPGIATGLVLAAVGVSAREAVDAYLMQLATSMTQNAIRAIPLGQDAGQRVLVGAYPVIETAGQMTMAHTMADLGVVAPRLEVAQMQHEKLHARMFMS